MDNGIGSFRCGSVKVAGDGIPTHIRRRWAGMLKRGRAPDALRAQQPRDPMSLSLECLDHRGPYQSR